MIVKYPKAKYDNYALRFYERVVITVNADDYVIISCAFHLIYTIMSMQTEDLT